MAFLLKPAVNARPLVAFSRVPLLPGREVLVHIIFPGALTCGVSVLPREHDNVEIFALQNVLESCKPVSLSFDDSPMFRPFGMEFLWCTLEMRALKIYRSS